MSKEGISFTFAPRDTLLYLQNGSSFVKAEPEVAYVILVRNAGLRKILRPAVLTRIT